MLQPRARSTISATLDDHADVAGVADRARLVHRHAHPRDLELLEYDARDLAGERLDQPVLARLDEREHALGDRLVVERVLDCVALRRGAQVLPHLEVDLEALLDLALPVIDADDCFGGQCRYENSVHRYLGGDAPLLKGTRPFSTTQTSTSRSQCTEGARHLLEGRVPSDPGGRSSSSDHRACARTGRSSRSPAARRWWPASAIIAALSVQNSGRGKNARARAAASLAVSASRSRRLAPTPPATTSVSRPVALSARRDFVTSVSTIASSKPRATSARATSSSSRPRTATTTAVFSPLKLKSRPGRSSMGRGKSNTPGRPCSARAASAGPPG